MTPDQKIHLATTVTLLIVDFILGRIKNVKPNNVPEAILFALASATGRFKKGDQNATDNSVGQSCPHCGSKS